MPGAGRFGIEGEGDLILGDSVSPDPPRIAVSRSHTPEWVERFIADTNFQPAIEKWVPGMLDEVRGIAEGAELPFEEIYVFQLADEMMLRGVGSPDSDAWRKRFRESSQRPDA